MWLRSTGLREAFVAVALAVSFGAVWAQDAAPKDAPQQGMSGGCESFKWPIDKERAAFDSAGLEQVASGAARGPLKEQAFALALAPVADVSYALPPTRKKKDSGSAEFGGIVAFAAPEKASTYQVTLSSEGWIDLVQDGAALKSADHSGSKNCPGLRKSVRFAVSAAPVTLQISGAPAETIKVGIRPAE